MQSEWQRFRLKQDGLVVASAEGPTALAEIKHYAMVYGQDGHVVIQRPNGRGGWVTCPL